MLRQLVMAVSLVAAACTGTADGGDEGLPPPSADQPPDGGAAGTATGAGTVDRGVRRPVIRLGVTDWTAARVTASIAEQLIERRLGHPVEQVPVLETDDMLDDLAAGELHAVLEVWPSTLEADERQRLESGEVEPLGELGVVGKVGWWVPRAVIDDPALTTWEALRDPEVAARFATAETGRLGRFLGTDPGYDQADEELIAELDLPFEVVYSGSEGATAAEVARSIAAGSPVLLYWWTPTAEIMRFDLVEVALPPRDRACEADLAAGEPQRCDYPAQGLVKTGWPGLAEEAPDLDRFLRRFALTTDDQLALIDEVDNQGRPVDQAAAGWVDRNADRWDRVVRLILTGSEARRLRGISARPRS